MSRFLILPFLLLLLSCEKNDTIDLLPRIDVNIVIDMNLPQYNNLQIPNGWVNTNGGINGIFIINRGVGNPPYKAFDRACPDNNCTTPMIFDGNFRLQCPCDESEYSILDGAPQTQGSTNFAREYKVSVNGSALNITNF